MFYPKVKQYGDCTDDADYYRDAQVDLRKEFFILAVVVHINKISSEIQLVLLFGDVHIGDLSIYSVR